MVISKRRDVYYLGLCVYGRMSEYVRVLNTWKYSVLRADGKILGSVSCWKWPPEVLSVIHLIFLRFLFFLYCWYQACSYACQNVQIVSWSCEDTYSCLVKVEKISVLSWRCFPLHLQNRVGIHQCFSSFD